VTAAFFLSETNRKTLEEIELYCKGTGAELFVWQAGAP
jgi:hypothetical protein